VQAGHRRGGIEGGAPGERESQGGEQPADVQPRVRTRHRTPAAKVQRADAQVEQRHHYGGRARREERVGLGGQGPGELGDVVTEVAVQHGVRDPEAWWPRGERGLEPPVAAAEREHQAERNAGEQGAAEQHPLRHRLHDLEVAESPGQLHRADGAVHDVEVADPPGERDEQDDALDEPREVAGREVNLAPRHRGGPGPLRGLDGEPATAHEGDHQGGGGPEEGPPTPRRRHGTTPSARSQSSTSTR